MTAPDAERQPDGVPIPPEVFATGQRMLAAIVFTDTVGFSALMSREEERTLRLVSRDLEHMKAACGAFGGQVLKSTGDGLLMLFTSAVQAVACALEIQRDIQKQNLELPKNEQLQHRIGIHLGDVFQNGADVMGDGVNIAARLQTQAVPGGICLSKTVYDVVQNRLPFYVNDLGARKLKNIGMVTAYQISPLENGPGVRRFGIARHQWRAWVWRVVIVLVIVLTVALAFELGWQYRHWVYARAHPNSSSQHPPVPATAAVAPLTSPVPQIAPAFPAVIPVEPAAPGLQTASQEEFQDACFQYMTKYDFDGMETWMQGHDWPGKKTATLPETCQKLRHLFNWAHQQMQKYSMAQPLKITNKEKTFYYWPIPFGGVKFKIVPNETQPAGTPDATAPKIVTLNADQLQPMAMVAIIHELLKEDTTPMDPLTVQLEQELHLFIQTYHIVLLNRKPETAPAPATAPVNPAAPNP